MDKIKKLAKTLALQNAVKHEGKANPKALIGGVLGSFPEAKTQMKEVIKIINESTTEVNKLSLEEQENLLRKERPDFDKKEKKEGLKPLPEAEERKVVMRFEPSPSGPLHVGHAYPLSLNLEYSKMYKGKFILRISDTNPDNIDPGAYEAIQRDAEWLAEDEIAEVIIQSDNMEKYYKYAVELFKKGKLYVCTCDSEKFKEYKLKGEECPCRNLSLEENKERWIKMKDIHHGYKPGEAVVRYKSSMTHKNPAMRDFAVFRINETRHPRQENKYRLWPMMNFTVSIDDMDEGMTHTLRGKDHADNAKKQAMIHEDFGFKTPIAISVGRINFEGFPVSCSKTKVRINSGEFEGWNDVRIPFLPALRRRGYQPEALRKYAVQVGVTKNDKTVHIKDYYKQLNALNKELIDPVSNRYFFVEEPIKIIVKNSDYKEIELDLHPDNKKGGRLFFTNNNFYIPKKDFENTKEGEVIRLIDCMTIKKIKDKEFEFIKNKYEKNDTTKLIQWLPVGDDEKELGTKLIDTKIIMPDNSIIKGLSERTIKKLATGTIIQFQRLGFCKLDQTIGETKVFCFGHK